MWARVKSEATVGVAAMGQGEDGEMGLGEKRVMAGLRGLAGRGEAARLLGGLAGLGPR